MKFAVFSLMQWPEDRSQERVYHDELDQLVRAEAQGYSAGWLAEHHFSRYGIGPSIHLTAAHLAARTTRLRIGTAVTILPFYHPIRVAEEIAMLDQLSGGRIDWGVGRGYQRHEFDAFEVDIARSQELFREQLEIVKNCWGDGPVSHAGPTFRFEPVEVFPKPVQRPHPPIWIATISPHSVEWAARQGYPVLSDQFSPLDRLEKLRGTYYEQAGPAADAFEMPILRHVFVAESTRRAREIAGPALLWYYRTLGRVGSPAGKDGSLPESYAFYRLFGADGFDPGRDPEAFLQFLFENCTVVGDPVYCRERIAELRERCRMDYLIAWQNFGGLAHEASLASQRLLIEKVAPAFA